MVSGVAEGSVEEANGPLVVVCVGCSGSADDVATGSGVDVGSTDVKTSVGDAETGAVGSCDELRTGGGTVTVLDEGTGVDVGMSDDVEMAAETNGLVEDVETASNELLGDRLITLEEEVGGSATETTPGVVDDVATVVDGITGVGSSEEIEVELRKGEVTMDETGAAGVDEGLGGGGGTEDETGAAGVDEDLGRGGGSSGTEDENGVGRGAGTVFTGGVDGNNPGGRGKATEYCTSLGV